MQTTLLKIRLLSAVWLSLSAGDLNAQFTGLADVNGSLPPGQFTTNSPGSYTMLGGGTDIWDTSDQFFFAYCQVTGNFDVRVRIQSLEAVNTWTKAGLMVRESLAPDSRMVFNRVTPATGANDSRLAYRTGLNTNGLNGGQHEDGSGSAGYPNAWLRLQRTNNFVIGYVSTNGTGWAIQNSLNTSGWQGGTLSSNLLLGLAVTSHQQKTPATAEFREFGNSFAQPLNITQQPTNVTVLEGQLAAFTVGLAGFDPNWRFQWLRNSLPISGATNQSYTTPPAALSDNGAQFQVRITNSVNSLNSTAGTLIVLADTNPPVVLNAVGDPTLRRVTVTFSERVSSATATNFGNYAIGNLTVTGARLEANLTNVILSTSPQGPGNSYTLSVSGIRDRSASANLIVPSQRNFTAWLIHPGLLLQEFYDDTGYGLSVSALTNKAKFPAAPDLSALTNAFFSFPNRADFYGARVSGFFLPPVTANYTFYGRGDDYFQLYLSSNDDPQNKILIINGSTCCQPFSAFPSASIALTAGQKYYIEGLMKDNAGGDFLQVAVKLSTDTTNPDSLSPIPGSLLSTAANPDTAGTLTILQHPIGGNVTADHSATLSVVATNSLVRPQFYQWQKLGLIDWTNIPGAMGIGPEFTTPPLTASDNNSRYRMVVSIPGQQKISLPALLTVTADTAGPQIVSVASLDISFIGVCFDELLDPITASDPANYTVNDLVNTGTLGVASATVRPDGKSVLLTLNGGTQVFSVSVINVRDRAGNAIAANATAVGQSWGSSVDVGFPTLAGFSYTCRPGDVDMIAGGADIWGTADQFQFAYQYWFNDFDMKVKVQRLDVSDTWAKAGLMARETLDDNSATIEAYTSPSEFPGAAQLQAAFRPTLGAATSEWGTNPVSTIPNLWLRMTRAGNVFTAFYGTNGFNWTQFGQTTLPLSSGLFVGLVATSHNTSQTTEAEFRNFAFAQMSLISAQPQSQTVSPGGTIGLSVGASGPEPFTYQWRLNGVNIPGANGPTYSLNNVTPKDGGTYTVVVANSLGIETSLPASVVVTSNPLPFTDAVGAGAIVTDQSRIGSGTNITATRQAGEPNHAHQTGGKSVWLSWRANFTGFVSFSTRGSGFDTLLAAYTSSSTNVSVTNLTEVVSDDDLGGFGTSSIKFNAQQNTTYYIAVDGFSGASGNIVLCWNFEFGQPVPQILIAATNRAVRLGSNTTFRVTAANATGFQWFLNGVAIAGATDNVFPVLNVQPDKVGQYTVAVSALDPAQSINSAPAYLEIGSRSGTVSEDKFEDLFTGTSSFFGPLLNRPNPRAAIISVAAGTLDGQVLNNFNSTTQQGEANHCGVLTAATRWVGLVNTNGVPLTFIVDTTGSAIDTIVAVYTGTSLSTLFNIACMKGPGHNSSVTFTAQPNVPYSVAVDGASPTQQGTIQLNWRLGTAPSILSHPVSQTNTPGATVTLNVQAAGVPAPQYQWRTNGVNLPNANSSSLMLSPLAASQGGSYSVVVSNFMGMVTSSVARVTVGYPFTLGAQRFTTSGMLTINVLGPNNSLATNYYILQGSTNLQNWVALRTNRLPSSITNFVDPDRAKIPYRFYRLVPYPPLDWLR